MAGTHVADYTTAELDALVKANDPSVYKFFGAKLEESPYRLAVRTPDEETRHRQIVGAWPKFSIGGSGYKAPPNGKAWLWNVVTQKQGKPFLVYDQKTGSCVGNGFGQAMNYLQAVETWQNGEAEDVLYPYFWLWDYGVSRWLVEPNGGPGEGSFGAAIAEAGRTYGLFAQSSINGLPAPDDEGQTGMTWGKSVEMQLSFINPNAAKWQAWRAGGADHLMKTSSLLKSSQQVAEALINGYPVTTASNWGGRMQCPVRGSGENAYLRNDRSDTWPHQMCFIGWWDHPTDGELFYCLNSWSIRAHGTCPTGAPVGGFWMPAKDVQGIANERGGELIAYSQYDGYKAQQIDWVDAYRSSLAQRTTFTPPIA